MTLHASEFLRLLDCMSVRGSGLIKPATRPSYMVLLPRLSFLSYVIAPLSEASTLGRRVYWFCPATTYESVAILPLRA